jgi:hypothetical protein
MAKVGVGIKLNLSSIDKTKLFKGEKGTYLDATVFIDLDNKDQHGNSGMVTQDWKDAPKGQTPILGNVRVFWQDGGVPSNSQQSQTRAPQGQYQPPEPQFDDDLPPF